MKEMVSVAYHLTLSVKIEFGLCSIGGKEKFCGRWEIRGRSTQAGQDRYFCGGGGGVDDNYNGRGQVKLCWLVCI